MRPDVYSNLPKGTTFARFVRSWAGHDSMATLCDGSAPQFETTRQIAKTFAPYEAKGINADTIRAATAVPVGTTSNLGPSVYQLAVGEILQLANGLGVFGPSLGLRPIPFDKPFNVLSTPDGGTWIAENAPKVPATPNGTGFADMPHLFGTGREVRARLLLDLGLYVRGRENLHANFGRPRQW